MKRLASRLGTAAFIGALGLTAIWFLGTLSALAQALGIWTAVPWLGEIVPKIPDGSEPLRLGETGDFLTGWLTPMALAWFVITVFMQKHELGLQRREFELLRLEYQGSRAATEAQAEHQGQSNKLSNRLLVRQLIQDSRDFTRRNAELTLEALRHLYQMEGGSTLSVDSGREYLQWRNMAQKLRGTQDIGTPNKRTPLTLSTIWLEDHPLPNHGYRARELIHSMSDQYTDLKREATAADMQEYFDAFCLNSIEGEIMKICKDLHDRATTEIDAEA